MLRLRAKYDKNIYCANKTAEEAETGKKELPQNNNPFYDHRQHTDSAHCSVAICISLECPKTRTGRSVGWSFYGCSFKTNESKRADFSRAATVNSETDPGSGHRPRYKMDLLCVRAGQDSLWLILWASVHFANESTTDGFVPCSCVCVCAQGIGM